MTEEPKKWYKSKTVVINILAILGALLTGVGAMLTAGQALTILGVCNLVIRVFTAQGLDFKFN